jgi:hypothetical protein
MKTRNRNFTLIALFVAFTLNFSTVFANDDKTNSNIELKFIGTREANSVFQLKLANAETDEFSIVFRDSYGNVLYADRIKGTNITQKFLLNSDEINNGVIKVEVRSRKTNKTEVFTINKSTRFVEETTVSKS